MIFLRLFKQLRPRFMIGFVVVWNVICFSGIQLNDGPGPIKTAPSAAFMALAAGLAAAAGFGPLLSTRLRLVALRDSADLAVARPGLLLFGLIGSLLLLGAATATAIIAFGGDAA